MDAQRVRIRLQDMITAVDRIQRIASALNFDQFNANIEQQWSIERGIEIISEASRRIPDEMTSRHAQIPWRDIRGIGNRIRHDYEKIDPFIVWTIATKHLTELRPVIITMLAEIDRQPASPDPSTNKDGDRS